MQHAYSAVYNNSIAGGHDSVLPHCLVNCGKIKKQQLPNETAVKAKTTAYADLSGKEYLHKYIAFRVGLFA